MGNRAPQIRPLRPRDGLLLVRSGPLQAIRHMVKATPDTFFGRAQQVLASGRLRFAVFARARHSRIARRAQRACVLGGFGSGGACGNRLSATASIERNLLDIRRWAGKQVRDSATSGSSSNSASRRRSDRFVRLVAAGSEEQETPVSICVVWRPGQGISRRPARRWRRIERTRRT